MRTLISLHSLLQKKSLEKKKKVEKEEKGEKMFMGKGIEKEREKSVKKRTQKFVFGGV